MQAELQDMGVPPKVDTRTSIAGLKCVQRGLVAPRIGFAGESSIHLQTAALPGNDGEPSFLQF